MRALTPEMALVERGILQVDVVRRNLRIVLDCLNEIAVEAAHDMICVKVMFLRSHPLDLGRAAKSTD
jgi:hypothetical protein